MGVRGTNNSRTWWLDLSVSEKLSTLYEHTQIQHGKTPHKTPTTDKCEVIYLSSVHQHPHLWHLSVSVRISWTVWMFKVPLKTPHRTEGGMFVDEASVSLWLSAFCVVTVCGRMCKTRGTAWWGMFTNHKLQLYVQTVYKTQSENSIKKAQRSTYAMTSIESKL